MKVMLVFPPQFDVTMPSLGLPCLTAALRKQGHDVAQRDINIEAFNGLLSKEELLQAHFRICRKRKELLLSGANPVEVQRLFERGKYLAEEIASAKSGICNKEEFYDFSRYQRNIRIIKESMGLLSMAYYPSKLTFYSYSSGYSAFSTEQIMEAIGDREQNFYIDYYEKHVLDGILAEKPGLIGISIGVDSQVIPGLTLAHMIRQKTKDIHISIGGSFFTRLSDNIKGNQALFSIAHSVIVHEGETAVVELVRCLEEGVELGRVPNLIYKKEQEIVENELRAVENVSELPTPDFEGLPLDKYLTPEPILPIYATRGCYWSRCVFCSFYLSAGGKFRYRGMDKVIEDINKLSGQHGCHNFTFIDEAIPPKTLSQMSEDFLKAKIKIHWSTHTRFEKHVNETVFKALSEGGCYALAFGLESACERVLRAMDKGTEAEAMAKILRLSKKAGIGNHVSLFFGFPSETKEEAAETIRFIADNLQNIDSICYESFNLVRGSKAYENAEKFGITEVRHDEGQDLSMDFDYDTCCGMGRKDAERVKDQFSKVMLGLYKAIQLINCHEALYLKNFKGQDLAWITAEEPERVHGKEAFLQRRKALLEELAEKLWAEKQNGQLRHGEGFHERC